MTHMRPLPGSFPHVDCRSAAHPRDRHRTTSTPVLLRTVAERAQAGARFTLLIPRTTGTTTTGATRAALKLLEPAAGGDVASLESGHDPLDTIHQAVSDGDFDELIVCTTPPHFAPLGASRPAPPAPAPRAACLGDPARGRRPIPHHVSDALPDGAVIAPITGGGGEF